MRLVQPIACSRALSLRLHQELIFAVPLLHVCSVQSFIPQHNSVPLTMARKTTKGARRMKDSMAQKRRKKRLTHFANKAQPMVRTVAWVS